MVYRENITAKKLEASVASLLQTSVSKLHSHQCDAESGGNLKPGSGLGFNHLGGGAGRGFGWRRRGAKNTIEVEKAPLIPVRHVIVALSTLACVFVYILRLNISVAIVAMVNSTAVNEYERMSKAQQTHKIDLVSMLNGTINQHVGPNIQKPGTCPIEGISADGDDGAPPHRKEGEFLWTTSMQGIILSSYYYGYTVTQVVGGRMAERYGAFWVCGSGVGVSSLLTLLTPIAARTNVWFLIAVRIIIGVVHGFVYSSLYCLFSQWVPKNERATALAFITVGGNLGAAITMQVAGHLCESNLAGGWPSVFYITGLGGLILFLAWVIYARNSPFEHPYISKAELRYLISTIDYSAPSAEPRVPVPWGRILTSPKVWASALAKATGSFAYLGLNSILPIYFDSILHAPIRKNGFMNALIYCAMCVTQVSAGPLSDFIRRKNIFKLTTIRKIFQTIAMLGPIICLSLVPAAGCNQSEIVYLLIFWMFFYGFITGGEIPTVADMAPGISGTVFGFANTWSCAMGIFAPMVMGGILSDDHDDRGRWNIIFYSCAGVYAAGLLIFDIFASAEPQPWGVIEQPENKNKNAKDCGRCSRRTLFNLTLSCALDSMKEGDKERMPLLSRMISQISNCDTIDEEDQDQDSPRERGLQ